MNGQPQKRISWSQKLKRRLAYKPHNRLQLIEMLRDAKQRHLLDTNALAMIEGVLHVSEVQVREIMVPRSQMVVIEHDSKLHEFLPTLVDSGHSRFPVIGENRDEVIGILLAKDMLKHFLDNESS